jgi:hypothetical protein
MMSTRQLRVGDRVKYGVAFLRSIACYTGPLPFARGPITELTKLGPTVTLATVAWDFDVAHEIPERVNVANLVPEHKPEA